MAWRFWKTAAEQKQEPERQPLVETPRREKVPELKVLAVSPLVKETFNCFSVDMLESPGSNVDFFDALANDLKARGLGFKITDGQKEGTPKVVVQGVYLDTDDQAGMLAIHAALGNLDKTKAVAQVTDNPRIAKETPLVIYKTPDITFFRLGQVRAEGTIEELSGKDNISIGLFQNVERKLRSTLGLA
jgi:hypothetical protein